MEGGSPSAVNCVRNESMIVAAYRAQGIRLSGMSGRLAEAGAIHER